MSGLFAMRLLLLAVLFVCPFLQATSASNCEWDKDNDFPKNQPFLMDTTTVLPLYPHMKGNRRVISLDKGAPVVVACPGNGNIIVNLGSSAVRGECLGGSILNINGKQYNLTTLGCSLKVNAILSEIVHLGSRKLLGISFQLEPESYYNTVILNFDLTLETTLYSYNVIHGGNIKAKDKEAARPSFKQSGFFSVSMSSIYTINTQTNTVRTLTGKSEYISGNNFFAKGHLAPDADFVLGQEQDSTYFYVNAVPQWQSFNNGNWKVLENAVRRLADQRKTDLEIWTGSYGILKLPDTNDNPTEIYLGMAENKKKVPAPELIWKIVYDRPNNRAAALVGVNNPHLKSDPAPICPDLCNVIKWVACEVKNIHRGYMYACTVESLRNYIPYVPDLGPVTFLDQ